MDTLADSGPGDNGMSLPVTAEHLAELRDSGLTDETIRTSGIYSETDGDRVKELLGSYMSAKTARALGPCLAFPFLDADENPLTFAGGDGRPQPFVRLKPTKPRKNTDGKPQKYESPLKSGNHVYIPPAARAAVKDVSAAIILTEGEKKSLAATQCSSPTLGLSGVWNWTLKRPKNPKTRRGIGPRKLIDDLERIAWQGRKVTIIFDSDLKDKPDVQWARWHFSQVLAKRGAEMRVVDLPGGPEGKKLGLDDYLLAHGPEELRKLIDTARPPTEPGHTPTDASRFTDSGYTVIDGNTFHCVLVRDKDTGELRVEKQMKLANFVAAIVGETVTDDGAEQTREFAVAIQQRNRPRVTAGVPVERFGSLDWIVERFGPRYVIQAGSGKRDHLRCAIQEMSGEEIPSVTVYTHTGWRQIGGQWCYLHGAGAIVPTELGQKIEVRLDGAAAAFRLPQPTHGDELRAAVRASLGILDGLVADLVAFPILATVYRAALGAPDFALWLAGHTGAQKSELAALAQQHYGSGMTRNRLPGNWSSTDNALEGLAFTVKDAVLVVDDFAPSTSRNDADRQHRTAERLIRGQGNHAGRQRMRADGTLRPPKPPRGLILATGEDVPRGHSIAARLAVIEVQRGSVNLTRLSQCQKDATGGDYASAMAGFLAWLAPQFAEVQAGLDGERIELRDQFVGKCPHARTPDIIANLLIGLRYLLKFAEEIGAIDRKRREELWHRGQAAFLAVADQQREHQRAVDPVARFPEMIAAILSSGRGHVAGIDGREPSAPPSPESWGWVGRETSSGLDGPRTTYQARGSKIGWVENDELYLEPDATYASLAELAREQGQTYPVTQQTLYRRLKEAGLLLRTDGARTTYPATVESVRRRVLVFSAAFLAGKQGQPGQTGQPPEDAKESVPVSRPTFGEAAEKPGHETGTVPARKPPRVPSVPVVPGSRTEGVGKPDGDLAAPARDEEVFTP